MLLFTADQPVFQTDSLSWIMAALIGLVIITVSSFSRRYMAGDRYYRRHAGDIFVLGLGVLVMVFADHLLLLLAGWGLSNLFLVRLMVHKRTWQAARNSGTLAYKTFGLGFLMLGSAAYLLADAAGTASIHGILAQADSLRHSTMTVALLLMIGAAMTQSGLWPFHKWLTSSLNSPTPVSALMHAGLVNGGGFMLVRFAPLLLTQPVLLKALFIIGMVTAITGTFWKLLQTDNKRMLACSTMGQMGFMVAQCGMGLFAPAVSHLVWHGLFKAYLFLGTGSVLQEKRRPNPFGSITLTSFVLACLFGAGGAIAFAHVASIPMSFHDTGSLMIGLAFMASAQLCRMLLVTITPTRILAAFTASVVAGGLYGGSIRLSEMILAPMNVWQPQPLDEVYVAGFAIISLIWLAMNMNATTRLQHSTLWKRLYIAALNGSQPHPATVTATRSTYQF